MILVIYNHITLLSMQLRNLILICFSLLIVSNCAGKNWAVLIAGSNSWFNYRHQADVLHAYQMLVQKGFNQDQIIVFAYDDIAQNVRNPFPGKVYNKPSYAAEGVDVYAGVKIDYSGADVNPAVFLDVLKGNKKAVVGKGTQKVVESTADDNIFIFFSDHGAPNLIAFPSKYLYADQLVAAFKAMEGNYKKIVFYLESCESGSMFVNLPTDTKIYALSAANPTESSWGTYCSPDDVIQGKHIGTCLGDLFSVKFVEDSEAMDITSETLQTQFEAIRLGTSLSHVMQWGDVSYVSDNLDQFMTSSRTHKSIGLRKQLPRDYFRTPTSIDSRLMKVKILAQTFKRVGTVEAERELREQMMDMQRLDGIFHHLAEQLNLDGQYSPKHMNYTCMRAVMDNHTQKCGRLSDYGLRYAKLYADACERYSIPTILQNVHC